MRRKRLHEREIQGSEIADEISYEASKSVLRRFYLEYEVFGRLGCKRRAVGRCRWNFDR